MTTSHVTIGYAAVVTGLLVWGVFGGSDVIATAGQCKLEAWNKNGVATFSRDYVEVCMEAKGYRSVHRPTTPGSSWAPFWEYYKICYQPPWAVRFGLSTDIICVETNS